MHKWLQSSRFNQTVIVLCTSCSKKDYKGLEIREAWKVKDRGKEFQCSKCGAREIISKNSSD